MFYVGQEVECVDDTPSSWAEPYLTKGNTYVIAAINKYKPRGTCVTEDSYDVISLVGVVKRTGGGFASVRFRPIQKRSTDISIFEAMLTDKKVDA